MLLFMQIITKQTNMKKIICFLSISLVLVSCSGDEDSASVETSGGHLIKTIVTDRDGTVTTNYTYDGDKIVGYTDSDGFRSVYTYTGDLITKWEEFDGDESFSLDTFTYDGSGRLVRHVFDSDEIKQKYEYTHNSDGTILVKHYNMDSNSGVYVFSHDAKIYDNKIEENVPAYPGSPAFVDTQTFTYDDKHNPFMNVTGFDKIAFLGDTSTKNYTNNELLVVSTTTRGVTQTLATTTYTYNTANLPITSTEMGMFEQEGVISTQYFYE